MYESTEMLAATGYTEFGRIREVLATLGVAPSETTSCCATGTCD